VSDPDSTPRRASDVVLRALRRTRQVRQFTDEPIADADLTEILRVARWSGSSTNWQPWTFIVVHERVDMEHVARLAPYARHVADAAVAIAIEMPGENPEWEAYDEGRVGERILVAAGALGLGAAIGWADGDERPAVAEFLGVTAPHYVRTIISIGHPTERARQPRSAPGSARRPLSELVRERGPGRLPRGA
jgi:nitroreductase